MFQNYIIIAWRNLKKNRGFSLTNLLGLAIGITCTLLILLWVRDELNYDKFHKNYDDVYQIIAHRNFNNNVFTDRNMALPLGFEVEKQISAVKNAAIISNRQPQILENGDLKIKKFGYTVSEHFFNVFTWQTIKGNPSLALKDPSSIILTKSTAEALFGNADALNQTVKIDNERSAKVAAVVADPAFNSSLSFEYIQPFNPSSEGYKNSMQNWVNSSWFVYLHLQPGTNLDQVNAQINKIKKTHDTNDAISTYFGFPMSKWRLYSDFRDGKNVGGMIEYVRLFMIIAIGILIIACVNFMNLSTARSEKRSREVGIRKTLGSTKKQLVFQFFFESMILAGIAFIISVIAVWLVLPSFNKLVDKHLTIWVASPGFWLIAFSVVLFTGLVAGSYPALYLSSFNPVKVLKGTLVAGKGAILPRRVLVVGQFIMSILLISGTIIVYQQIQHVKGREMGYDPNNLIMIPTSPDVTKNYPVIKQELIKTGMVNSVTRSSSPITEVWWKTGSPDWIGKPPETNIIMSGLTADLDFTKTMGIKILEGRDFTGTPGDSAYMLLNKAAVKAMQLKRPVGMKMQYGKTYTVLGVIDDMIMESPFQPVSPMLVIWDSGNLFMLSIRLNAGIDPEKAMPAIRRIFQQYNPAVPFEYQFVDEQFGNKFLTEELINRITNLFAALAIFICCIGLAGLSSFTIEKRRREIGIRKVLGATLSQLLSLISKEFIRLVSIAFLIAIPLAWWIMSGWLRNYTYHVDINVWLFVLVGFLVLALTLIVVGANTMNAARHNPVKNLRQE